MHHVQHITEKVKAGQLASDDFPNVKFVNREVILIPDLCLEIDQEAKFHYARHYCVDGIVEEHNHVMPF